MTVVAGTSPLQGFLDFMEDQARSYAGTDAVPGDLDALLALAVAWYGQLGRASRQATVDTTGGLKPTDPQVLAGLREAHARYYQACQPVLRLIERARVRGEQPARMEDFMGTVGEAYLIAYRQDRIERAERAADAGQTRPLAEVRDELRRRAHPAGG